MPKRTQLEEFPLSLYIGTRPATFFSEPVGGNGSVRTFSRFCLLGMHPMFAPITREPWAQNAEFNF
jgi:hypothetical protein